MPNTKTLASLVRPDLVFPQVRGDKDAVLRFFADQIARENGFDAADIYLGLTEREALGSTAVGRGVAIPHCRTKTRRAVRLAIGVAPSGVAFGAADGEPVRLFFVVVSAASDPSQNLRALAAVSKWVQTADRVERLVAQPTREDMMDMLTASDD